MLAVCSALHTIRVELALLAQIIGRELGKLCVRPWIVVEEFTAISLEAACRGRIVLTNPPRFGCNRSFHGHASSKIDMKVVVQM